MYANTMTLPLQGWHQSGHSEVVFHLIDNRILLPLHISLSARDFLNCKGVCFQSMVSRPCHASAISFKMLILKTVFENMIFAK